jgi:hypothetical protein
MVIRLPVSAGRPATAKTAGRRARRRARLPLPSISPWQPGTGRATPVRAVGGVRAVRGGADALLSLFPPERQRPLRQAARGERFGFWVGEAGARRRGDQPDYALSRRDAFLDGTGSTVVHYSDVLPAASQISGGYDLPVLAPRQSLANDSAMAPQGRAGRPSTPWWGAGMATEPRNQSSTPRHLQVFNVLANALPSGLSLRQWLISSAAGSQR